MAVGAWRGAGFGFARAGAAGFLRAAGGGATGCNST
jgi:hypothetical protein